jgi:hypothetical protein
MGENVSEACRNFQPTCAHLYLSVGRQHNGGGILREPSSRRLRVAEIHESYGSQKSDWIFQNKSVIMAKPVFPDKTTGE